MSRACLAALLLLQALSLPGALAENGAGYARVRASPDVTTVLGTATDPRLV